MMYWLSISLALICAVMNGVHSQAAKCKDVIVKMDPKSVADLNAAWTKCIADTGLQGEFDPFYESTGKNAKNPNMAFYGHIEKKDAASAKDLRCCVLGERGVVNGDGTLNVDALIAKIIVRAEGDAAMIAAIEKGKAECPSTEDCDVIPYKKCLMQHCTASF